MDFANKGNRPQQQTAPAQTEMGGQPTPQAPQKKKSRGFDFGKFSSMIVLFGVAILAAALIAALVFNDADDPNLEADLVNRDQYQAVFLDSPDGQVYFGKLAIYNDDLYILNDIYYVRVEQPIQPQGEGQQQQANISLAKLGNELHGPEDVMFISRDKVLYWENLKDEGQVVTAITEFKANGEQPAQQQTPAATPAAGTQPAGTPQETDTPAETPVTP